MMVEKSNENSGVQCQYIHCYNLSVTNLPVPKPNEKLLWNIVMLLCGVDLLSSHISIIVQHR